MTQLKKLEGRLLTPEGWVGGSLRFNAAITAIEPMAAANTNQCVLPGFIDLHVHGGAGADVMAGEASVRCMAAFHAQHGTTALLATTVTAPVPALETALAGIARAVARPDSSAARVLGAHLEGPFISPHALGAQPPFAIPPDRDVVEALAGTGVIRVATIAPEIDPDGWLVAALAARKIRVQIGHTICTYAQAVQALSAGATGFTHLFNAMSGLEARAAGAVGCALAHGSWAELILDRLHVENGAVLAAMRAIPGVYGVTDAVAACGMPDGEYALGTHRIHKAGDSVRLADGGLAGSVLTMERALRNLMAIGLPLEDAARRLSSLPAAYLGLEDRGRLEVGTAADLVVVDRAGRLQAVFVEGREVELLPG
jgi:N-acetylglucosamine-6-phosphate deacetylase